MKFVLILLGVLCLTIFAVAGDIEFVDDSDLIHLLTKGDNVVALFTKKNCPECVELENILSRIGNELQEQLGCVVVKAENSHMVNLYNPKKEPSLIFFRQGIPLLYSGNYNAEDILELFNNNKEPVVKELSDENFEHLTQASTGATTGDWFIFFYSPDCVLCQRLYAIWESVGARLRNRLNVARVNRAERGVSTAQRFQITKSPELIFIRSGKFYRYKSQDYTANSFVKFASGGYVKDSSMEEVPGLPSFVDEVMADHLRFLQENQIYVIIGVGILVLLVVIVKSLRSTKKVDPAKKKEKSKNK